MIPIIILLILCVQVNVFKSTMRSYNTNVIDGAIYTIGSSIAKYKQSRTMPRNLRGFKPRWNQVVKRDEEKGSISIYTPWYFKPRVGYTIVAICLCITIAYFAQDYPWGHLLNVPMAMGATFTGKASGVWDTEGQTTWNEAGHPVAGDTITTGAFDIICGSATACAMLTLNAGGSLNTTTNNYSLTTTSGCNIVAGGILTTNGSSCSFTGVGGDGGVSFGVRGTFIGGTGPHIIGGVYIQNGSSYTATNNTTTFNNVPGGLTLAFAGATSAFDSNNGTIVFNYAGGQLMYDPSHTARVFYNLIINNASCALSYYAASTFPLTIANNLTITAGSFTTWDGTTSASLIANHIIVHDTLLLKASVTTFNDIKMYGTASIVLETGGSLLPNTSVPNRNRYIRGINGCPIITLNGSVTITHLYVQHCIVNGTADHSSVIIEQSPGKHVNRSTMFLACVTPSYVR